MYHPYTKQGAAGASISEGQCNHIRSIETDQKKTEEKKLIIRVMVRKWHRCGRGVAAYQEKAIRPVGSGR